MRDQLNMGKLNALPHPLYLSTGRDTWWPVIDICVQTCLCRIDVCGLPEIVYFGDLKDSDSAIHEADDFYLEDEVAP